MTLNFEIGGGEGGAEHEAAPFAQRADYSGRPCVSRLEALESLPGCELARRRREPSGRLSRIPPVATCAERLFDSFGC